MMEIKDDGWGFTFATPPCSPFSRAVMVCMNGPQHVCSFGWPDGLPWLKPSDREKCDVGTALAFFALKAMEAVAKACGSGRPGFGVKATLAALSCSGYMTMA